MVSKRDKILTTALQLFITAGYANTPTSLISKQAGVATGTLFHHFKTKEAILNQLYVDSKQSIKNELVEGLAATTDIKQKFQIIWKNYLQWAVNNPDMFDFLVKFSTHPAISQESKESADNTYSELFGLIQMGSEQGFLANLPVEYLGILTELHFNAAASYCVRYPQLLQKKKFPKRLFQSYWQSIS